MGCSYTRQVFIVWNSSLTGHSAFYFLHLFLCTKYANPTRGVWAFARGRGKEKEEKRNLYLSLGGKGEGSSEEVTAEWRLGDGQVNQGTGKHSQQKEYILSGISGNMLGPPRNLPGTSEARVPDATRNVRRRACRGSQGLLHPGYAGT